MKVNNLSFVSVWFCQDSTKPTPRIIRVKMQNIKDDMKILKQLEKQMTLLSEEKQNDS